MYFLESETTGVSLGLFFHSKVFGKHTFAQLQYYLAIYHVRENVQSAFQIKQKSGCGQMQKKTNNIILKSSIFISNVTCLFCYCV